MLIGRGRTREGPHGQSGTRLRDFLKSRSNGASVSTAHYAQSRKCRLSPTQRLHILIAALGLVRAASTQAEGVYFQNSYDLVSPSNIVNFSEFSPPPNTITTTQFQGYG